MKNRLVIWCVGVGLFILVSGSWLQAIESGRYRLLSLSTSSKMLLVSHIPNKTKYLLDAGTAKITVDGKPAEFKTLQAYAVLRIRFELRKATKDGIEIDGSVSEIQVVRSDNPQ